MLLLVLPVPLVLLVLLVPLVLLVLLLLLLLVPHRLGAAGAAPLQRLRA